MTPREQLEKLMKYYEAGLPWPSHHLRQALGHDESGWFLLDNDNQRAGYISDWMAVAIISADLTARLEAWRKKDTNLHWWNYEASQYGLRLDWGSHGQFREKRHGETETLAKAAAVAAIEGVEVQS